MFNEIRLSGNTSAGLFDGAVIGNMNSSGIAASNTADFGPTAFTLPAGVTPGRYYLKVKADVAGTVSESDEDNNIRVDTTPIDVAAGTGHLNIAVKSVDGQPPQDGALVTCKLYSSGWDYVEGQDKTGDSIGVCRWQGLVAASYFVEVYYNGASAFPGAEFWGSTYPAVDVAAGVTKDEVLTRSWPYGASLEFRQGSSTGAILSPGAAVTAGQTIWVGLNATQNTGGAVTASGRIALSLDQSSLAHDSGDLAAQTVQSGEMRTFEWAVTPTLPGIYHAALRVQAQVNGEWVKTDGWRWFPAFVVTAPCVGHSDQLWQTLTAPDGTYSIRIVTKTPIADTNRALSEGTDGTNLRSLYVLDEQGSVVKAPLASELVLLAQSAKKYSALHQTDPLFWEAIRAGDVQRVSRSFLDTSYDAWRPYAVQDWWAYYFIFADKTALPALDSETKRTKIYKQVLLDLALQPDVSDAMTEDREAREWLEAWREGLETADQVAGAGDVVEAIFGLSDEVVNAANLAAFHRALREGSIPSRMPSKLEAKFNRLGTTLSALSLGVNLYSDVVRFLYLQTLANVAAEQRLEAVGAMIRRRPTFDPALAAALEEAEAELSALEAATYDEVLGPAIGEAAMDNLVEMVELGAKIGEKLVGKTFATIAKPYFLSWEVYKGIREQTDAAQEATAAATLVELMTTAAGSDEYDRSQALLATGSYSLSEARDALNLLNSRYYLAWYFYGKYLDITANGLTWLWGRGIDFLGVADYSGFIDYLEGERAKAYDACVVTAGPAYLAKHARGLQRSATDSEKQFLMSRLRFERPAAACEPFDPEIVVETGQLSGPSPLVVDVRGQGAPTGASWIWSFGDGVQGQGDDPPEHSFHAPGAYLLSATVQHSGVTKKTPPLAVLVSASPVAAEFVVSPGTGPAPLTVTFTDTSTGPVLSRRWEFGDGTSSSEQSPAHTYGSPGMYTVALTVYGPENVSTLRRSRYVEVVGSSGDLEINLNVPAAVQASGGITARGVGPRAVFLGLPAGTYQLRYGPLAGYECPTTEPVSVVAGQRTLVTRTCVPALAPRLEVSPGEVTFGYVEPGGSVRRSVLVANAGGGSLSGEATTTAPFGVVSGTPFVLSAGASREIAVDLAPSTVGDWAGSLNVSSSAGNAAVALSGGSRCGQLEMPVLTVPTVAVSNAPFVVGWSNVAAANAYDLEESDSPEFVTATATTVAGLSVVITRAATSPRQIYFRIRSKRTCADATIVSPWSATGVCNLSTVDAPLFIWKTGTGEGTVWSDPSGILCSPTCSASFPPSQTVNLTAVAGVGSRFVGWSGDCTGGTTCTVTMTQTRNVTAEFALDVAPTCYPVTLSASPVAGGTVARQTAEGCAGGDTAGTSIPILATPAAGFSFAGWTATGCTLASTSAASTTCTVEGTGAVNVVGAFQEQSGSDCAWSVAATMPTARTGSSATLAVVRGKISVIGSHDGNPGAGTYNEEYDPATDTWKSNTPYPRGEGRYGQGSDAVIGDTVYLIGGTNIGGNYNTQTVDLYNPVTDEWTLDVATYPVEVSGLATASYGGRIYSFGGGPYNGRAYTNAYEFDPGPRTFAALPAMPTPRYWAKAFVVDGKIWVAGGFDAYPFEVKSTIDVFDPVAEVWSSGPALPRATQETSWVGVTAAGEIYAVYDDDKPVVYRLVRASGTWEALCDTGVAQAYFGVATVASKLHFIGNEPKAGTHQVLTVAEAPPGPLTVSVSPMDSFASEAGGDTGQFKITRAGNTDSDLTVAYAVDGTATAGTDFQPLPGTITILAGSAVATMELIPLDDLVVEESETVVVTLVGGQGYAVGVPSSATVTIEDDDLAAPIASNGGPVCEGETITLTASDIPGASYAWTGPNGFSSALQNPTIPNATAAMAGAYSVTATVGVRTSPPGTTSVVVNAVPTAPTPSSNSPVTEGGTIQLTASTVAGATYSWTGPNGFMSPLQNPTIANAGAQHAGTYSVRATIGGCPSPVATTSVAVTSLSRLLTVTRDGSGTGAVFSTPFGIACGTNCSASYSNGTVVTLTAVPGPGSSFSGWGGACTGSAACSVAMSEARSVKATFTLAPALPAIYSFAATPGVLTSSGTSTLAWTTSGATSVTISGLGGTFALSGTRDVSVATTTTYTLTATNAAGSVSATATINVLPPAGTGIGTPVVTAPGVGQVISVSGVGFTWNAVSTATGYEVRLFGGDNGAAVFEGSLSGNSSTSTLITLPDGDYVFAVRACRGAFTNASCGSFASRPFRVQQVAPEGVPIVTSPGAGSLLKTSTQLLGWTAVAKADPNLSLSYEVLLTDVAAGNKPELQITVPDPTLSTIYTLHSSALYELKVRACQAGCGPWSEPVTFTVDLKPVPKVAPGVPSCTVNDSNYMTCSWAAVAGADFYSIYVVQPSGGPGGGALTVAARLLSETTVTLPVPRGLSNVIVAACTGDGCGPWSGARQVEPIGPNPSVPNLGTPLAGSVVNGPGVEFSWNRIPGDDGTNTWYRLYVQDLSRQSAALDIYTKQNFWAAYFKAEGARYDVLVVANPGLPNEVVGPPIGFSVRGTSSTAPTMVSPPHQSVIQSGNVQLGWSPVPFATLYQYYVAVLGQGSAAVTGVTPGLVVQVPLPAVAGQPTTYSGITRACMSPTGCSPTSDAGWGPWSNAPGGPGVTNFTVVP
jgi:PKD repeat protein